MPKLYNHKGNILSYICLLLVACALSACNRRTVYHAFQPVAFTGWRAQDTIIFNVPITDSLTYYHLSLDIRNRNSYPYQDIRLGVQYEGTEIPIHPVDTLHFFLADAEGRWNRKGCGGLYQSRFPVGYIRIAKAGNYQFKINYLLPDTLLTGINDIGLLLKKMH